MQLVLVGFELVPLHARAQDLQNVIENLEVGDFRLGAAFAFGEMRQDVAIEVFERYPFGKMTVSDIIGFSFGFLWHTPR